MGIAAQINIRIEPQLKDSADRVLARFGISPSQAIRGLYESLARGGDSTERALQAISANDTHEQQSQSDIQRKLQSVRDVQAMLATNSQQRAINSHIEKPLSDKELLEEAIWVHHSKKGLLA